MTCIAADVKTLAADRKVGDTLNCRKIIKLKKGGYLAAAGYYDDLVEVARWIDNGMKDEACPFAGKHSIENESEFLYVDKAGNIHWLTSPWLRPVRIVEKFVAIGSGAQYAMGAMAHGATARQAVAVACRFDPACGFGIDVVKVKP